MTKQSELEKLRKNIIDNRAAYRGSSHACAFASGIAGGAGILGAVEGLPLMAQIGGSLSILFGLYYLKANMMEVNYESALNNLDLHRYLERKE